MDAEKCQDCVEAGARSPLILCGYTGIKPVFSVEAYDKSEHWRTAKHDVNRKFKLLLACWKGGEKPSFDDPGDVCPETLTREQDYRDQMNENLQAAKSARLKSVFRMSLLTPLFLLTIAVHLWLAWMAFTVGERIDAGDITFREGTFANWIAEYFGGVRAFLYGGFFVWLIVLIILLQIVFYLRHRTTDVIVENIHRFFDQHIDQHWARDLKDLLARIGDGDRSDVKENSALRVYHLHSVWRRLERLSARIEAAWTDFRDVSGEGGPASPRGTAIPYGLFLIIIFFVLILLVIPAMALGDEVPIDVYDPFVGYAGLMLLLVIPTTIFCWWRLKRNSLYVGDRIEAAILLLPDAKAVQARNKLSEKEISERERRFADLDPTPLVVERYRSALSDLDRLIS